VTLTNTAANTTKEVPTVRYRAELRCYLCSRGTATLEWDAATPMDVSVTRPGMETVQMEAKAARAVRCVRCNGPTFIEEIEKLRQPLVVTIEPAKRGRPRKADKERELAMERELLARIA
jgi:hypothetical protein